MKFIDYPGVLSRRKEIFVHGIFWLLLGYFVLTEFDSGNPIPVRLRKFDVFAVSAGIIFITTFYINYLLILPRVFRKIGWVRVLCGIASGFLSFILLRYFTEEVVISFITGYGNYYTGTSLSYYIYDNLYYGSFPLIISSILWILIFNVRLLSYNKFIVQENSATEIKFLRAQLNPHFMFNTLNNIYSLVYFKSEKALPAIEKLGELMRYTTYETNKEKIALHQEVEYIESYLELEQLRHEKDQIMELSISVEDPSLKIPPFLLSPLVENALKHGIYDSEDPIRAVLHQNPSTLCFEITNRIGHKKKDKLGGIGLENLKKILNMHFPNKHSLEIDKNQETFNIELKIQLDGKAH